MLVQIKIESQSEKAYKAVLVYNDAYGTKRHHNTWIPKSVVEVLNENETAEIKDWFLNKLSKEMADRRIIAFAGEKTFSI